ncbi:predicted protein [Botrytis cinerea T4]|uniref:Uncharacterized protein n=1 Tax=Botryotinia fuckeliana (strain T4) TaxID=999810 RepID=G2YYC7_BOTF4|nr:predicted protein [Botrytis cinerea T4]
MEVESWLNPLHGSRDIGKIGRTVRNLFKPIYGRQGLLGSELDLQRGFLWYLQSIGRN